MVETSFLVVLALGAALIAAGAWFTYQNRKSLNEMCCMMSGMTFGMIPGFYLGALFGLSTGDFFTGAVVGAVAGTLIGIPMGQIGGNLARMEGVMAGPMGGLMGGMTGVMMRFYNVDLFVPFLVAIVGFVMFEMTRLVWKSAEEAACCAPAGQPVPAPAITKNEVMLVAALAIVAVVASFLFNYSPEAAGTAQASLTGLAVGTAAATSQPVQVQASAGAWQLQEVKIRMEPTEYAPDVVTVKRGQPVRLTLEAAGNAGCTRSFVMPDFGIRTVVPRGGSETFEFTPDRTGDFPYRCSMNMARGTLRVVD
jgi:heme/copper-type cytochrome/quinol oxidase subunit 2